MLLRAKSLTLSFGLHPLFSDIDFQVNANDRIAIIGRNGMGKSSLLKIIMGELDHDAGVIEKAQHVKIAMMQQHVPRDLIGTVGEYMHKLAQKYDVPEYEIQRIISELQLSEDLELVHASGGQIRRLLLGAALVNDPDVLLLDEPTNHMDIDTILWMEQYLLKRNKALIFISHDRDFMQKLATRIFEIDLGRLICWSGDYQGFLKHKEIEDIALARSQEKFDKKLAQEEVWIRQGIKARRTRNEGRVRALKEMRQERSKRATASGNIKLVQGNPEYAGKICFTLDDVSYQVDNKKIISHLSTLIMHGDKIGILGPNGCGKSTLFKLLVDEIKPDSGDIKLGSNLKIAYFDQHRQVLDLEMSAIDNVSQGRDSIEINGVTKHIISYLQDFLFTPDKARSKVKSFSGGERNRLLLAKILSKPSNVLILDEPSNDLDMDTLTLLESFLMDYPGTILMASHDRALLNNVVTSLLVFRGDGAVEEYVGDYAMWCDYMESQVAPVNVAPHLEKISKPKNKTISKLSYNEQRELKKIPAQVESLEAKISALHAKMSAPDFYQQDAAKISAATQQCESLERELEQMYQRWEDLESRV
jgi:ATP-binding cassette subfamily F protein uup